MMTELELITEVAKGWNNLDIKFIQPLLTENFSYSSQWVFDEMHGKQTYLDYLSSKFLTIKKGIEKNGDKITAEVAFSEYYQKHCIVLTQNARGEISSAWLILETENSLIERMDLCIIPSPKMTKLSGIIPK